jgi:hypothetical protein
MTDSFAGRAASTGGLDAAYERAVSERRVDSEAIRGTGRMLVLDCCDLVVIGPEIWRQQEPALVMSELSTLARLCRRSR